MDNENPAEKMDERTLRVLEYFQDDRFLPSSDIVQELGNDGLVTTTRINALVFAGLLERRGQTKSTVCKLTPIGVAIKALVNRDTAGFDAATATLRTMIAG